MLKNGLKAKIIEKGKDIYIDHIMKMRYDNNSNTLYITDHRGAIFDIDLDDDVKIQIGN